MYFCYLLRSEKTPTSKATYIGFSVDPLNRLRQHNGEIVSGARKTAKSRPWKHVAIVGGFPSHQTALQFEWQWQHPTKSRNPDLDRAIPKGVGYKRCLLVLACLLKTRLWRQLDLVVYFFSEIMCGDFVRLLGNDRVSLQVTDPTQFEATRKANPSAPDTIHDAPLCQVCNAPSRLGQPGHQWAWTCNNCNNCCHLVCLAQRQNRHDEIDEITAPNLEASEPSSGRSVSPVLELEAIPVNEPTGFLPRSAACPCCGTTQSWAATVIQARQQQRQATTNSRCKGGSDTGDVMATWVGYGSECEASASDSGSDDESVVPDDTVGDRQLSQVMLHKPSEDWNGPAGIIVLD